MKTKFRWFGMVAVCIVSIITFFVACNRDGLNDIVTYRGQVVYINTTTPFPNLQVKVTNGTDTHCQSQTDEGGNFTLKVRVNEIDGNYYLLAGDSTCVPKKVGLGGYGQAEVDLGVIEVEGPALPTVKTTPVTEVTAEGATLGGEVMTSGRLAITARGICYGTAQQPTIEDSHTTDGSGLGAFTSTLKNLEHNTIYYARAYATNKMGTSYGEQVKFTTELGVPIVVTDSIIRITAHSAKCKGHVESDGGYKVTTRGTCWSKRPDPTIDDDCTNDGSDKGEFTSTLNNLIENTTYYVRTYATNSTATVYGEQIIITTLDGLAVVKTDSVNNVTATGFTAFGTVVSDCDIPVTARGFCYSTSQYPTIEDEHITVGKGLGSYQGNIRNLQVGSTYYVRAYATNETGTVYGEQRMVTTKNGLPIVETNLQATSTALIINAGGKVIDSGGFNVTDRGICYSVTNTEPTITDNFVSGGKGNGSYNVSITELTPNTSYNVRAYAINENGTSYGIVISVKTKDGMPVVSTSETTTTSTTISSGGNITSDGGYNITARGVCYSSNNSNPTIEDSYTTSGIGTGSFTTTITNIDVSTTYYVRAYATNSITTGYGDVVIVTTGDGLPSVSTTAITMNGNTFLSGGNITDDGGFPILERGICYGQLPHPDLSVTYIHTTDGIGTGYYTSIIESWESGVVYVRAYATNEKGTSYGNEVSIDRSYLALPTFSYDGQTYKVAPDPGGYISWEAANSYCENLTLYGYNDWRMPTIDELETMYRLRESIKGFATDYQYQYGVSSNHQNVYRYMYYLSSTTSGDKHACIRWKDGVRKDTNQFNTNGRFYLGYLLFYSLYYEQYEDARIRPIRIED